VVKVVHRKLGEKYYKKKGKVVRCKDRYTAVVEMLDNGDVLKIDQAYLETVIPALGKFLTFSEGLCDLCCCQCVNVTSCNPFYSNF